MTPWSPIRASGSASEAARKGKNQPPRTFLSPLGGGSAIDTAKSAALLITNGGYLKDYAGVNKVSKPIQPLIAVPTTAGTGSEVTIFAVMSDPEHQEKFTISSALIAPAAAVLDPVLTLKLPPSITAFTGMDALTHALEAYTSSIAQPATDALALSAVKLIPGASAGRRRPGRQYQRAGGHAPGVRSLPGWLSTALFSGLAHAIASPLGGYFHVPHGLANAVMLPYVIGYNLPAAVRRYADIGSALGLQAPGDTPRAIAAKVVSAVTQLARDINIPEKLRDIGAREEDLPLVARDALKSIQLKFNVRNASERGDSGIVAKGLLDRFAEAHRRAVHSGGRGGRVQCTAITEDTSMSISTPGRSGSGTFLKRCDATISEVPDGGPGCSTTARTGGRIPWGPTMCFVSSRGPSPACGSRGPGGIPSFASRLSDRGVGGIQRRRHLGPAVEDGRL